MNAERNERLIRELMGKSEAKMPFPDFEDRLMGKIQLEEKSSRSFRKDIKLSGFFFLSGILFGVLLGIIAGKKNETLFGFTSQPIILMIQSLFFIFSLTLFDKLIRLTGKHHAARRCQPVEAENN